MNSRPVHVLVLTAFLCSAAAEAGAQVCTRIDEAQDTLTQSDRTAAVLLFNRQLAMAGEQVVADCPTPFLLAHIKLGNTITVTLSGPRGDRQGTALGLDDLPALYNQMVRSLLTGQPMTGLAVVDRTNVTVAQATPAPRVRSDSFTYARLGYGGIFGDQTYRTPSFGFGYRAELDKVALDVSFLNFQAGPTDYYGSSASADSSSFLKLSGLYLLNRDANSTPYFGGGLSWGPYERMPPGYVPPAGYRAGSPVDDDDDEPNIVDNPNAPRPPGVVPGAPPMRSSNAAPLPPRSGAIARRDAPPLAEPNVITADPDRGGMLPPPPERFPQRAVPAAPPKPVKRAAATPPKQAPLPKPKPAAQVDAPAASPPQAAPEPSQQTAPASEETPH